MSAAAAIGFRGHMGWVAAVAVSLEDGAPRLVHSSIIATAEEGDRIAREPYHVAAGWEGAVKVPQPKDPAAVVARGKKAQLKLATAGIAEIIGLLKVQKLRIASAAVLATRGLPADNLEHALSHQAHVPVAESASVRNAVRAACGALKIKWADVDEKSIYAVAQECLGLAEPQIKRTLTALGAGIKPWAQDQKLCVLAAWLALAEPIAGRLYKSMDLGPGGHAKGPADKSREVAQQIIRRKHKR